MILRAEVRLKSFPQLSKLRELSCRFPLDSDIFCDLYFSEIGFLSPRQGSSEREMGTVLLGRQSSNPPSIQTRNDLSLESTGAPGSREKAKDEP